MITTNAPYIANAIYVLNFKEPILKVRYEQGLAEDAFQGFVNGQSRQTNFPDQADPTQARIVFSSDKKNISISQVTTQLQMTFKDSGLAFAKQYDVSRKNFMEFQQRALKFKDASKFGSSGLVLDINFPTTAPTAEVQSALFSQFLKLPQIGEVAATQLTAGFKIDGFFFTITVSGYEQHQFDILLDSTAPIHMLGGTGVKPTILESGISVRIDVNDLPKVGEEPGWFSDANVLIGAADNFLLTHFKDLTGLNLDC